MFNSNNTKQHAATATTTTTNNNNSNNNSIVAHRLGHGGPRAAMAVSALSVTTAGTDTLLNGTCLGATMCLKTCVYSY